MQHIPYHEYIIWSKLKDFTKVTQDVVQNYDDHYARIHGRDSKLPQVLSDMRAKASDDLYKSLSYVLAQPVNMEYKRLHGEYALKRALCTRMRATYDVLPSESWGRLPATMQSEWVYNDCDYFSTFPINKEVGH